MKARDVMSKGIMQLMRKSPFYSTIIVKQQVIEDEKRLGGSLRMA